MKKFVLFAIASILGTAMVSACPTGTGPPTVQKTVCDTMANAGHVKDSLWKLTGLSVKNDTVTGNFRQIGSGWAYANNTDSLATKKYARSITGVSHLDSLYVRNAIHDSLTAGNGNWSTDIINANAAVIGSSLKLLYPEVNGFLFVHGASSGLVDSVAQTVGYGNVVLKSYADSIAGALGATIQNNADSLFDTLFANHTAPNVAGIAGYIPGGGGSPFGVVYPVTGDGSVTLSNSPTATGLFTVTGKETVTDTTFLGNISPSLTKGYLTVAHNINNHHINFDEIRDLSSVNPDTDGTLFDAFDVSYNYNGPYSSEHLAGYQSRIRFNGSDTLNNTWAFYDRPEFTGGGRIINRYAFKALDPGGYDTLENNYGFYADQMTYGKHNWAIWTDGTTPSFFGGTVNANGGYNANTRTLFTSPGLFNTKVTSTNQYGGMGILDPTESKGWDLFAQYGSDSIFHVQAAGESNPVFSVEVPTKMTSTLAVGGSNQSIFSTTSKLTIDGGTALTISSVGTHGAQFPIQALYESGGTQAAPTASQNTKAIGEFAFVGHNGTGYSLAGGLYAKADGNWSGSNQGVKIGLEYVPNGATIATDAFIIHADTFEVPLKLKFGALGTGCLTSTAGVIGTTACGTTTGADIHDSLTAGTGDWSAHTLTLSSDLTSTGTVTGDRVSSNRQTTFGSHNFGNDTIDLALKVGGRSTTTAKAYFGLADPTAPISSTDSIEWAGNGTGGFGMYAFGNAALIKMGRMGGTFASPTATTNGNTGLDFQTCIDTASGTGKVMCNPAIITSMLGTASPTNRGQAFTLFLTDSNSTTLSANLRLANRRWNFNGATDIVGTQFHFNGNAQIESTLVVKSLATAGADTFLVTGSTGTIHKAFSTGSGPGTGTSGRVARWATTTTLGSGSLEDNGTDADALGDFGVAGTTTLGGGFTVSSSGTQMQFPAEGGSIYSHVGGADGRIIMGGGYDSTNGAYVRVSANNEGGSGLGGQIEIKGVFINSISDDFNYQDASNNPIYEATLGDFDIYSGTTTIHSSTVALPSFAGLACIDASTHTLYAGNNTGVGVPCSH